MNNKAQNTDTEWMANAFLGVQKELQLKLKTAADSIVHSAAKGAVSEKHWIEVFRAYFPDRYEVESGFVIDSAGHRSEQIDIVVFDRHFTPILLGQQDHRYIPAEAVYAVFEAKPCLDKAHLRYAGDKAASVRRLYRTSIQISHAGGTFPPKPLFPIVAGIVAAKASWSDGLGDTFRECLPGVEESRLDCGCALDHGAFDSFKGKLEIIPAEGALIYFLFRLLGKLQSLGSVPAIDWGSYANILLKT